MSEFDPKIDYYAVLGVGPNSTQDEILKAYHALAAKYHPDKHQGNDLEELAREKLAQLNAAYAVIGNSERRARYDAARRGGGSPFAGGGGAAPGDASGLARPLLIIGVVLLALILGARFLWKPLKAVGKLLFEQVKLHPYITIAIVVAVVAVFLIPRLLRRK